MSKKYFTKFEAAKRIANQLEAGQSFEDSLQNALAEIDEDDYIDDYQEAAEALTSYAGAAEMFRIMQSVKADNSSVDLSNPVAVANGWEKDRINYISGEFLTFLNQSHISKDQALTDDQIKAIKKNLVVDNYTEVK